MSHTEEGKTHKHTCEAKKKGTLAWNSNPCLFQGAVPRWDVDNDNVMMEIMILKCVKHMGLGRRREEGGGREGGGRGEEGGGRREGGGQTCNNMDMGKF